MYAEGTASLCHNRNGGNARNDPKYEDDGGAEKGDERRLRRARRHWSSTILSFLALCLFLLVRLRSKDKLDLKADLNQQRTLRMSSSGNGSASDNVVAGEDEHMERFGQRGKTLSYKEQLPDQKQFWVDPRALPPIPGTDERNLIMETMTHNGRGRKDDFQIRSAHKVMAWEKYAKDNVDGSHFPGPLVDFTNVEYEYPEMLFSPFQVDEGEYPPLEPLGDILERWPQDDIDNPPSLIVENLQIFDFSDPVQRQAALAFREAELPFKVYNVPELTDAGLKWTDEYVSQNFDYGPNPHNRKKSKGTCQQSHNNFFAFFTPKNWNVETMGPPPTYDTDWNFALWAKHARYADAIGLRPDANHYYWQSGVPHTERRLPKTSWTFVSLDLPSFSDPNPNFFSFNPKEQKGIQCRFGERGVTAATHYDAGRNMVAMITGAKRYILSPPKACTKLGIVSKRGHPSFRHSMLNFAHMQFLDSDYEDAKDMHHTEEDWLRIAKDSPAIDTVLKAGEVLYIPSHWFHYIISLQKSAQCNVRSGREVDGTKEFGGFKDVVKCVGE